MNIKIALSYSARNNIYRVYIWGLDFKLNRKINDKKRSWEAWGMQEPTREMEIRRQVHQLTTPQTQSTLLKSLYFLILLWDINSFYNPKIEEIKVVMKKERGWGPCGSLSYLANFITLIAFVTQLIANNLAVTALSILVTALSFSHTICWLQITCLLSSPLFLF